MDREGEVAVGGTFYNGEKYLDRYLCALEDLNYPKGKIHLRFVYSKSTDRTLEMLQFFMAEKIQRYASIIMKEVPRESGYMRGDEGWGIKSRNVVAALNKLTEISKPYDLVVMEQDIVVPPDTLRRLLTNPKADIMSGITLVAGVKMAFELKDGSVFMITGLPHIPAYVVGDMPISHPTSTFQRIYLPKGFRDKVVEVKALGTALVYVKREVLDKIAWRTNPKCTQDIDFCHRARELGFRAYVDTGLWYDHLHYSYRTWVDKQGRFNILMQDSVSGEDIAAGFLIPKEEVERQGNPDLKDLKLIIPKELDLEERSE